MDLPILQGRVERPLHYVRRRRRWGGGARDLPDRRAQGGPDRGLVARRRGPLLAVRHVMARRALNVHVCRPLGSFSAVVWQTLGKFSAVVWQRALASLVLTFVP